MNFSSTPQQFKLLFRRTSRSKSGAGFTLIELLVVVAIIGMLLSIISLSLGNSRLKARDTKRLSDMRQFKTGMDLYYSSGGGYPDTPAWAVGSTMDEDGVFRDGGGNPVSVDNLL